MDKRVVFLGLYPDCEICTQPIVHGWAVVILADSYDSASYESYTRPFKPPQGADCEVMVVDRRGNVWRFKGEQPSRSQDTGAPETAPVHVDCFELFRRHCTLPAAMDHLFTLVAWRKPWRTVLPLRLPAEQLDLETLTVMSNACAWAPPLHKLPLELVLMIHRQSIGCAYWRAVAALWLARQVHVSMSAAGSEALLERIPLRQVLSWERGGKLERAVASSKHPRTLMLTLDSAGICEIERLSHLPLTCSGPRSGKAFIVQDEDSISDVPVQLKHGRLRLHFPPSAEKPILWNSPPTATSISICRPYRAMSRPEEFHKSEKVMRTVQMDQLQGLTFIFNRFALRGIHPHYHGSRLLSNSAMETLKFLPELKRQSAVWIYLPISQHDRIRFISRCDDMNWITGVNRLAVETKLGGGFVLGTKTRIPIIASISEGQFPAPSADDDDDDDDAAAAAPLTLAWSQPVDGSPISFLAAGYSPDEPGSETPAVPWKPGLRGINDPEEPVERYAGYYESSAPLDSVESAVVFYGPSGGVNPCRGIMFHYLDGSCRTVGQCRVGVDPTETVVEPGAISFCNVPGKDGNVQRVLVEFKQHGAASDDAEDAADSLEWKTCAMSGLILFMFRGDDDSFLDVLPQGPCVERRARSTYDV